LNLLKGEFVFPQKSATVPADRFFFWPFNLDLNGVKLVYATMQPVCRDGDTFYFAETPGVKTEFLFDQNTVMSAIPLLTTPSGQKAATFKARAKTGGEIKVVILSEQDSLALTKDGSGKVMFDKPMKFSQKNVKAEAVKSAGPAHEIPLVGKSQIAAAAPTDDDYTNAAVWQIKLPAKIDLAKNPLLRIQYIGDVARLTLNGKLIADNFYAGRPFDLGLKRYGQEIFTGDLRLEILPLRKDAPIYIEPRNRPDFGSNQTALNPESVELIHEAKPVAE
jgi:hypothetical protein